MKTQTLSVYWSELPTGKENAATYETLCNIWGISERAVRNILHELSLYDGGDDYILIRSAQNKGGFYKTDNVGEILAYKQECLNKGKSMFAPVKRINEVLNANDSQYSFENNLRVVREECEMKQSDVVDVMQQYDRAFDKSLLSKMENNVCLPTFSQLAKLAQIYGCTPSELIDAELF